MQMGKLSTPQLGSGTFPKVGQPLSVSTLQEVRGEGL